MLTRVRPVDVEVPQSWDPGFGEFMRNSYHYHPKNLNHNSGNPIGISVCQLAAHNQQRVTASGAYLSSKPANLTVKIEASVAKVLLQNQKAIGIEVDGIESASTASVIDLK